MCWLGTQDKPLDPSIARVGLPKLSCPLRPQAAFAALLPTPAAFSVSVFPVHPPTFPPPDLGETRLCHYSGLKSQQPRLCIMVV